jgi:TetR/AcrR family transcriptional regulator
MVSRRKTAASPKPKPAAPPRRKAGRRVTGATDETTRQRLVQAALAEFSRHGFDGASTRAIAGAVEANHALIKYYFKSKAELWREVVDTGYGELWGILRDVPRPPGEGDAALYVYIRRLVHALTGFWARKPELARVVMHEGARASPQTTWLAKEHVMRMNGQLGTMISSVQRAEGSNPGHTVILGYMVTGSILQLHMMAPLVKAAFGLDPSTAGVAKEQAELFLRVFLWRVNWDDPALAL